MIFRPLTQEEIEEGWWCIVGNWEAYRLRYSLS